MLNLLLLLTLSAHADRMEVIHGTTAARSSALDLHAGGLVVREGEPGVAFASLRIGKGKRQPAFVLILKHRLGGEGKSEFDDACSAQARKAEARQTITIDGKTIRLDYKVALQTRTKNLDRDQETLILNGQTMDLSRGRVFLIDLEEAAPVITQRKVALPAEVDAATAKKSASMLAAKLLGHLRGKDARVKKFTDETTGK